MNTEITTRLSTLEREHESGRKMLAELDEKRASLMQTMLRIEGAMQVLRELKEAPAPAVSDGAARPELVASAG